ncbi:hypothetical protein [Sulfuricurvum sp.]|uniref:hypothetical protein n=1 Tax=Sulfuricurvum sp. TaxID=2025608 RepID=UPI00286E8E13|nr:hypothetical protein [Sulfuricurvum sp.]
MKIVQGTLFSTLILSTLSLGGCAMAKSGVLTFEKHNIKLKCFDASDLKIGYGNYRTHGLNNREYTPNHQRDICPSKKSNDDTKFLSGGMGYYRAFEGPLRIQWHALDDSIIDTTVDLDEIFPGKIIPNKEDPNRIYWPIPTSRLPFIVIEVNDRTLSIYSDADISIVPEDGNVSNRASHRNRTLMFSKIY